MNKEDIELQGYGETEWKSKTVKLNKQTIKLSELDKIIHKKVVNFIGKYMREPRYIKMPLWIKEAIIRNILETHMKTVYLEEGFEYRGMKVCETITISEPEEIEVF